MTKPYYNRSMISTYLEYISAVQEAGRLCANKTTVNAAIRFGLKGGPKAVTDQLAAMVTEQVTNGTTYKHVEQFNNTEWAAEAQKHYPKSPDSSIMNDALRAAGMYDPNSIEDIATFLAESTIEMRDLTHDLHDKGMCLCHTNR